MELTIIASELLVVVAGILIALWINGWHARRGDRNRERAYIESLREDIRADLDALQFQIQFADGTAEAARTLMAMIRQKVPAADPNLLLRTFKRAGMMYPFRPTKTTFQELSGGSNLSIIRNRAALRTIIEYYRTAEFPEQATQLAIRRIWVEYYDALSRAIDPALIPAMTLDVFSLLREGIMVPTDAPQNRQLPALDLDEARMELNALVESPDLERALAMVLDSAVLVRESLVDLQSNATSVLKELNNYDEGSWPA